MIQKKLLMAIAMTTATFFTSCTEEHDLGGEFFSKQTIVAEMAETSDAPQSRTCVDVKNPSTSFVGLLWQVADKLGVFNQDGTGNAQFSNNGTEIAPKADFSGELEGTATYAYFPYSADNAGRSASSLLGKILAEQPFDPESGSLVCDYKVGQAAATEDGKTKFTFTQLMTMLRITLDASGTDLEGERLNNIILTVIGKDGNVRNICGDFTFNATNGKVGTTITNPSNSVSMPWTTRPTLANGKSYQGFISILPNIVKKDDKLNIQVISEGHKATFTANCVSDLLQGYIYNIPLKLKEFPEKFSVETLEKPTINSFKFEVAKNTGKLLEKKLEKSGSKKPSASNATYEAIVNDNEITLQIPYLYDFKLKPTISFNGSIVKVNGVEFKNGETEVDFTRPVIFTVYAKDGGSQDYTVKITNTGLPVVVVTMSESGDYDKKYKGGVNIGDYNIGGDLLNDFVDIYVRGKDTEWVEDDNITVYNPDGTVDCSGLCGVRLRGNTTQTYPKKPFAIKLKAKTSVLGMPEHKRWVLLANQLDHSMIRNAVAFDIAHAVEYAWRENSAIGEGIPWCPSGQHVELVVISKKYNKAYHVGNYFLAEQVKIDGDRLNIKDPFDIEKPGASDFKQYGFLIEAVNEDKRDEPSYFKSSKGNYYFQFKDELNKAILNDVKTKIQRIENNIGNGKYTEAYAELDINSMIDQMLIWELTLNREYGDPSSVYMYMDGDGKLSAGPVWDFDRGTFQNQENAKKYGNSDRVKPDNEWMYWRKSSSEPYVWYPQLANDATFQATVKQRWDIIYPYLNGLIENQIRLYGESLKASWNCNNGIWPSNTTAIKSFKSDFKDWSGDEELSPFEEVINNFVTVYKERLDGMDALITSGKFTK